VNSKTSTFRSSQGLEMPVVEGQHVENRVALGENND
jgi:hypothetical protein